MKTSRPPRILVTGSRDWADETSIEVSLRQAWADLGRHPHTVLVSGACPTGADAIAERIWASHGLPIERHPADWQKHGRAAGPIRNNHMVELGADLCLAFIKNNSRGATHTALIADRAEIPVRRHTSNDTHTRG